MKYFLITLFSLSILIGIFFIGYVLIRPTTYQKETQITKETQPSMQQSIPREETSTFPEGVPIEADVLIQTNKGDIAIDLYDEKTPITAANFRKLAANHFYDQTKFHRVIPHFMIQGGDPTTKGNDSSLYGQGGPDYTIADEFVEGLSNVRGTISMANTGQPNSGGSQFFINVVDNTGLDYDKPPFSSSHAVFGKVVAGLEVADSISNVETGENDIPVNPVVIERIFIR